MARFTPRKLTAALVAAGSGLAMAAMVAAGPFSSALAQPAPAAKIEVMSPANGAVVQSTDIPIRTQVSGFNVDCKQAGAPDSDGVGHIHAMLDGMSMAQLTNFYCTPEFTISGQGVAPGQHELIVDLASNTHVDMMETHQTLTFLYQPTTPPAALPEPGPASGATVDITGPADGATIGKQFNLNVAATNFTASCDLEGKQNVAGYGHYHVFVDMDPGSMMMGDQSSSSGQQGEMEMMSMAGMISMPCESSIPVDLSAWSSGTHTISVELEQNDHTPLMEPGQMQPKFKTISINVQ